jgi:tyrosyl-DNA phosphodiesterase 1
MTEPPAKRQRMTYADEPDRSGPASLTRSISPPRVRSATAPQQQQQTRKYIASPFCLTKIRDLPPEANAGAVGLHDLLGDPLIAECWEFNYLHDINFLLSHFDEDVRSLVRVHVVHGFWKREDPNRLMLEVCDYFAP